ncbi:TonB-dependent receptor [Erythrobacter sp. NAP1]|uniref:TonB-dependent receptor n=1 Tax=Erythrobacter sp. NAP1 TaxID=237727 RepID=UPI000068794B|nr:TonB-dependent receptor [Erythrobacter sp. NAP1]EAQ28991.1 TonB-dependent receptor [Erythrobacter sp. NAP1]
MTRKLAAYAAGLMACSSFTAPAFAQDNETQAEPSPAANDRVIIVTATRRAQDIQDVPIAVTAATQEQLDRQGVVNVQNITQVSPSFSTSQAQIASGTVVLRIRGVGTTSNNIGFESAVGIFIDGAYQSRPGVALSEFVDIERVEVLRGPQGTLFGRNTSAGALNITTNRPDVTEFGGFANATYGNFDLINVQGAINVPVVEDTLALRLTGAYRERDGFIDILDPNGNEIGESGLIDQHLVRAQLGYEGESGVTARFIFDYSANNNQCCSPIELLAAQNESNGVFAAVGLGPRGRQVQPFVARDQFDTSTMQDAMDDRTVTANRVPMSDVEQWGVTGEIQVPLSDAVDLIYIGSYRDYQSNENYDTDFTGVDFFDVDDLRTEIQTMTHELRIQGEAFDGRLDWLIGGFYSDEDISAVTDFSLGEDTDALYGAFAGGALGPAPIQLLTGVNPAGTTATNRYDQQAESFSVFTHNVLEVTDGLSFTLGLRYSDEKKEGGYTQIASNNPACLNGVAALNAGLIPAAAVPVVIGLGCFGFTAPAIGTATLPLPQEYQATFKDEELIYTGKISYEFEAPITAYASFTHGYKAGGINLDVTAAIGGADPTFESEEVDAYELGIKAQFLDDAVTANIAIFREEFDNLQILEFTGAAFQTFNVPEAVSQGFELESVVRPDENLTINLGLTYTDASYPDDCAGNVTFAQVTELCGNDLTNAPDVVAIVGATYERDLGDNLQWFLNGQVRTESDRRTSTQASNPGSNGAQLLPFDVQDGNTMISMRAGIGAQDKSWTLEAWAVNLTNEITRNVTFNTTLRASPGFSARSAFIAEPRTYGVTLRTEF